MDDVNYLPRQHYTKGRCTVSNSQVAADTYVARILTIAFRCCRWPLIGSTTYGRGKAWKTWFFGINKTAVAPGTLAAITWFRQSLIWYPHATCAHFRTVTLVGRSFWWYISDSLVPVYWSTYKAVTYILRANCLLHLRFDFGCTLPNWCSPRIFEHEHSVKLIYLVRATTRFAIWPIGLSEIVAYQRKINRRAVVEESVSGWHNGNVRIAGVSDLGSRFYL